MTDLQPGEYVTHSRKPEWGTGRIVGVVHGVVEIRFEGERDTKRFPADRAATLLTRVPAPEVAPVDISNTNASRARSVARSSPGDTGRCRACNGKLNRSRYSTDGRWKSCPRCSAAQGMEHVLRRQPEAFGTTTLRETDDNPSGIQSYCVDCRRELQATTSGSDVRLCSELLTQAKPP